MKINDTIHFYYIILFTDKDYQTLIVVHIA